MPTETIRTVLDAPVLPIFDEDEIRWQECQARLAALLATPAVAAILAILPQLTGKQTERLETVWLANFRIHRVEQLHLSHRLGQTDRQRHADVLTAKEHVWRVADQMHGQQWTIPCAAQDAAFAALYTDLLDTDEARLFTKPWDDVIGCSGER